LQSPERIVDLLIMSNRWQWCRRRECRGCKRTPKRFHLSKILAKSLKIWQTLKIWAKMAPKVVWFKKMSPNIYKIAFLVVIPEKIFMICVGENIYTKSLTFRASLRKNLSHPQKWACSYSYDNKASLVSSTNSCYTAPDLGPYTCTKHKQRSINFNLNMHTLGFIYHTGATRWDGARGKKQVWHALVRTWGLSQANVPYWRKCLWHCWDFSAHP